MEKDESDEVEKSLTKWVSGTGKSLFFGRASPSSHLFV